MHAYPVTRRRFLTLSGALGSALLARSAGLACPGLDNLDPMKDARVLAGAINNFATDLHTRLSRDEKSTLFYSPLSISAALAMTSGGAKGKRWRLDWDILPGGGRWENPLMGWASS